MREVGDVFVLVGGWTVRVRLRRRSRDAFQLARVRSQRGVAYAYAFTVQYAYSFHAPRINTASRFLCSVRDSSVQNVAHPRPPPTPSEPREPPHAHIFTTSALHARTRSHSSARRPRTVESNQIERVQCTHSCNNPPTLADTAHSACERRTPVWRRVRPWRRIGASLSLLLQITDKRMEESRRVPKSSRRSVAIKLSKRFANTSGRRRTSFPSAPSSAL